MRVAVAGATGAVGSIMLDVLRKRGFPADEVVPFATERSAGRTLEHADAPVQVMSDETVQGFDLALFSAGGGTSREWAPRLSWFSQAASVTIRRDMADSGRCVDSSAHDSRTPARPANRRAAGRRAGRAAAGGRPAPPVRAPAGGSWRRQGPRCRSSRD